MFEVKCSHISLWDLSMISSILSHYQQYLKRKRRFMCRSLHCRLQSGMARFCICQIVKMSRKLSHKKMIGKKKYEIKQNKWNKTE